MKLNKWNGLAVGFTAIISMAYCMDANATKPDHPDFPKDPPIETQRQGQAQVQGQKQGQKQQMDQSQSSVNTNDNSNAGNSQSVAFQDRQQVHSAIAPSIAASNPCALGGSAAIGLKHVNIGGGRAKVDPECEKRETARLFAVLDERELAVQLLCTTEAAQGLDGCVPHKSMQDEIKALENQVEILLHEREHDQEVCAASKDRIAEACRK